MTNLCADCGQNAAKIKTAKDEQLRCANCFIDWFEKDVHQTISETGMFARGDRVGIGVSGGKDSTVLAHVLNLLNRRHDYGLELVLLCVDEGIKDGDDSIREVHKNEADLGLPLTVISYQDLYGWTMDEIVARIGRKNNCTFCGVFRRQALDRAALRTGCTELATGHNADDAAETVLMNFLRGDVGRLQRMGAAARQQRQREAADPCEDESLPRVKPLKYSYEKDIVMYAHFGKLNYFSTECIYAPNSYRNHARSFVKDLERIRPRAVLDMVRAGESLRIRTHVPQPTLSRCERCAYISSQRLCKACLLLEGLNGGMAGMGISRKVKPVRTVPSTSDETSTSKMYDSGSTTILTNGNDDDDRIGMNGGGCGGGGGSGGCACGSNGKNVDF